MLEGGNYTYGTVTEITYTDNGTDGTTYTAEGIYTVDQQDYYFYFKCDNTTYEGELIKVLFDGEDPSIYALKKNFIPTYVFSGVFIFIGCFVLCLVSGVFVRQRNLTDADFYRMKIESEKRAKMIEEIDDVWNYDITNLNRNKKSYKKENPYMDERIYKDRTIQTKPNSAKVRMGTTAFYKKEKWLIFRKEVKALAKLCESFY